MKNEDIERIWNESQLYSGEMFRDLSPITQGRVLSFVQAIEAQMKDDIERAAKAFAPNADGALKVLDIMMRTYGAAVAWRDKYKVAKGSELFAAHLVELCNNIMEATGWHPTGKFDDEPGSIKLIAAPDEPTS